MSNQQTISDLRAAKALIEKGWTQGEYARNDKGRKVYPRSGKAICFCAEGAVIRACNGDAQRIDGAMEGLREELLSTPPYFSIFEFNDYADRTQAEVIKLFDDAIASLEAEAA